MFSKQISIFSQIAVWNWISTKTSQTLISLATPTQAMCWVDHESFLFSFPWHNRELLFLENFYNLNTKFSHTNSFSLLHFSAQLKKEAEKESPEWFIRLEGKTAMHVKLSIYIQLIVSSAENVIEISEEEQRKSE